MFSRIHQKLGTAGFIIAIVALVASLGGAAWAAQGLNGKQKKEVKKIAKRFAGKKGAKGATGPVGATGATGATGLPGAPGKDGAPGKNGADGGAGAAGKSIETGVEATGTPNCGGDGGAWVQPEGTPGARKYACAGQEGSPWTAGGVLPANATETGAWGGAFEGAGFLPISFAIPLAAAPTPVIVAEGGTPPAECDNGGGEAPSAANPEADAGFLCVFVGGFESGGIAEAVMNPATVAPGVAKTGALIFATSAGADIGSGTFAVTGAPTP